MNRKLTISTLDEKVPFPAAVRGSKTPVLKLSINYYFCYKISVMASAWLKLSFVCLMFMSGAAARPTVSFQLLCFSSEQ